MYGDPSRTDAVALYVAKLIFQRVIDHRDENGRRAIEARDRNSMSRRMAASDASKFLSLTDKATSSERRQKRLNINCTNVSRERNFTNLIRLVLLSLISLITNFRYHDILVVKSRIVHVKEFR